jgi:hypothetical protein
MDQVEEWRDKRDFELAMKSINYLDEDQLETLHDWALERREKLEERLVAEEERECRRQAQRPTPRWKLLAMRQQDRQLEGMIRKGMLSPEQEERVLEMWDEDVVRLSEELDREEARERREKAARARRRPPALTYKSAMPAPAWGPRQCDCGCPGCRAARAGVCDCESCRAGRYGINRTR